MARTWLGFPSNALHTSVSRINARPISTSDAWINTRILTIQRLNHHLVNRCALRWLRGTRNAIETDSVALSRWLVIRIKRTVTSATTDEPDATWFWNNRLSDAFDVYVVASRLMQTCQCPTITGFNARVQHPNRYNACNNQMHRSRRVEYDSELESRAAARWFENVRRFKLDQMWCRYVEVVTTHHWWADLT